MLTAIKQQKLLHSIKTYKKKYLDSGITELDESGTRLLINSFLADVLGYKPIEEIKTEYMIKGTYADYVVQVNNTRHFLVEVKALSFNLSDKHLRQTINYGANEGIEYAMLTNGRDFQFYKIIFDKPIEARKLFDINLSTITDLGQAVLLLQYLHRESIVKYSFTPLWNKCEAMDPLNIGGMLLSEQVLSQVRKLIKHKYKEKCGDNEIRKAIELLFTEKITVEEIRPFRMHRVKTAIKKENQTIPTAEKPQAGMIPG